MNLIGDRDQELIVFGCDSADEQFGKVAVRLRIGGSLAIVGISFRDRLKGEGGEAADGLAGLDGGIVAGVDPDDVGLGIGAGLDGDRADVVEGQSLLDESDVFDAVHLDDGIGG